MNVVKIDQLSSWSQFHPCIISCATLKTGSPFRFGTQARSRLKSIHFHQIRVSTSQFPKESKFCLDEKYGMIYLKIINAAMKTIGQTIRVSLWVILGIAILLNNLAFNQASQLTQAASDSPAIQTGTVVATQSTVDDEAGSTDWIMLIAVVIVLIVITPILLKRRAWENGKRNRTVPPR